MEYSRQNMIDDQFFGSGYKIETHSWITARKLANEFQIEQLMVSEKLKPIERFKHILLNGSDIQKWSAFENLSLMITEQKQIKGMFESILSFSKDESKELFGIMAFGLSQLIEGDLQFSQEELENLTTFAFKILGYEQANISEEWVKLLRLIYNRNDKMLVSVEQYVTDSFDFKASEHRRLMGILLIEQFFQFSQKFRQQTIKKLLLFSQDRNNKCRLSICNILGKHLKINQSEEVWKVILDYSKDKDSFEVRSSAATILTTVYRKQNFQSILGLFEIKEYSSTTNPTLPDFLNTFSNQVRSQQTRSMFLNLINGSLKGKGEGLSPCCTKNILALTSVYGLKFLNDLSQTLMKVGANPQNYNKFIILFSSLPQEQRSLDFRSIFYQILKSNSYTFGEVAPQISKCLSIQNQNDLDVCIKLCTKSLESSLWNAQNVYLQTLKKWKYSKLFFDRVVVLIIKHLAVCPEFLNNIAFQIIRHLLLMNKKRRDFMLTLKQKMANNKCWTQRRNYIQMYEYLYRNCSWQLMSEITPLPMYIFVHQKVLNIKLEQCKFIQSVYEFINPAQTNTKNALKQHLIKYTEDKNSLLTQYAANSLRNINKTDGLSKVDEIFKKNNQLYDEQNLYEEIQQQPLIKEVTTYKALVSSKQNLSTSKKPDAKKISLIGKKQTLQQISSDFKKTINNPAPISRKSAIIKAPTLPIDLSKVPKKFDKK